jgi:hypothetical protein
VRRDVGLRAQTSRVDDMQQKQLCTEFASDRIRAGHCTI